MTESDHIQAGASNEAALTIDIVSDVVCPWCFIGKRKLEQALARRPGLTTLIRWRPFQLDPTIPPGGLDRRAYLEKKFGGGERVAQIHERVEAAGREVGIAFAFDRIKKSPNTLDAHRVIRWAHTVGRQGEIAEALFRLYFQDGVDIGDRAILARVAAAHGLDGDVVARLLDDGSDTEAVRQEIASAVRLGVSGVPFFIFEGKSAVPGAQHADILLAAIDKVRQGAAEVLPA